MRRGAFSPWTWSDPLAEVKHYALPCLFGDGKTWEYTMTRTRTVLKKRALKPNTFFGGAAILAASIGDLGQGHRRCSIRSRWSTSSAAREAPISTTPTTSISLLLTISTAGLPVAVSKMVSEANALGRQNQVHKVFRLSLAAFLTLGVVSFLIMYFGSEQLAGMMHDSLRRRASARWRRR